MNPKSGLIVNWNNQPAKDFPAGDDQLERELDPPGRPAALRAQPPPEAEARPGSRRRERRGDRGRPDRPVLADAQAHAQPDKGAERTRRCRGRRVAGVVPGGRGSRVDADRNGSIDQSGAAILDKAWSGIASTARRAP